MRDGAGVCPVDVVAYWDAHAGLIRRLAWGFARRLPWTDMRDFLTGAKIGMMEAAQAYTGKAIPFPFEPFAYSYVLHGMRAIAREERRARGYVVTTVATVVAGPRTRLAGGRFAATGHAPRSKPHAVRLAEFNQWDVALAAQRLTRHFRGEEETVEADVPDAGSLRRLEEAVERCEQDALLRGLPLTARQRAVLEALLGGETPMEIARRTGVGSHVVYADRDAVIAAAGRALAPFDLLHPAA